MPREQLISQDQTFVAVILPTLGASLLIFQIVYWVQLFETVSFYVSILIQSFTDIVPFMVVLLIVLSTFTTAVAVMNNNHKEMYANLNEKD